MNSKLYGLIVDQVFDQEMQLRDFKGTIVINQKRKKQ